MKSIRKISMLFAYLLLFLLPKASFAQIVPNPLEAYISDFDCSESYYSDGFEGCDVDVSIEIRIPRIYSDYMARSVDIRCDVEVSYETQGSVFPSRENESEYTSVYLSGGWGSDSLSIDVNFGYTFSPVVSAKVEQLSCYPE